MTFPSLTALPKPIKRFAIVKLWPELKTAEDECVARIKLAASIIGVECVEVNADGYFLDELNQQVSKNNVDFVIHLHFDTPKLYDAFSFVALWNPVRFYHEWGYYRCTRNLVTHDDFISCGSDMADSHVSRIIKHTKSHLKPYFSLYHSLPDIVSCPSLGDFKLFYAGINWEAVGGNKSRHQDVLRELDKLGLMRIYGPNIFQGVRVWAGYKSYVGEIPFDGVSMVGEISRAGIALVLSSQAHKESSLMSSRLFEGIASGALIICDENPFAKKFFGNTLLYINGQDSPEKISTDIVGHINWAMSHPDDALSMIVQAQHIFKEKFTLVEGLQAIYEGLEIRKSQLLTIQNPSISDCKSVVLNLLLPIYSREILLRHLQSVEVQDYPHISPRLFLDSEDYKKNYEEIESLVKQSKINIEIFNINFMKDRMESEAKYEKPIGEIIHTILDLSLEFDALIFVAPNESLFSNHISVLIGALQVDPTLNCASTAAIIKKAGHPLHGIHELIDFDNPDSQNPIGFGRFIFRASGIPGDVSIALPFLDEIPLAILVGDGVLSQQLPATIVIYPDYRYPSIGPNIEFEREIIRDYFQKILKVRSGFNVSYRPYRPQAQGPQEHSKKSFWEIFQLFFKYKWVCSQINMIKKHGFKVRFKVLKNKLHP